MENRRIGFLKAIYEWLNETKSLSIFLMPSGFLIRYPLLMNNR
jgi:hypothetical protein